MGAPWRIEMLGGFRVVGSGRAITRFRTRKAAALLARLASQRGKPVARETLVEMLWPRSEPALGRSRLRQALTSVRKQLEPPGTAVAIVATHDHVELSAHAVSTDVADFELAASRGDSARAVELYAGELLPGHYEEWIAPERERLRARFLRAAHDLSSALLQAGDARRAAEVALGAVGADPASEEARRDLARAYAACGEHAKAVAELEALERVLRRELGAGPSIETRELARRLAGLRSAPQTVPVAPAAPPAQGLALLLAVRLAASEKPKLTVFGEPKEALASVLEARAALGTAAIVTGIAGSALDRRALSLLGAANEGQVLCSEETAVLLRHEGAKLHDHGLFRLGRAPERVFELCSGDRELAPPRAARAWSGWLPLQVTRFFGRDEELARIEGLLSSGRRIVTITGAPGTGKTRLAIEAAARLRERFTPYFVALRQVEDPRLVPIRLLEALGEAPSPAEDPIARLARAFGSERVLFVVDGVERSAEAVAATISTLSERSPGVGWLVTSRARLELEGETELALAPLPTPRPGDDLAGIASCPSVALFVDRAQLRLADFQASAANGKVLAEIARRLDGIPLALELAADRVGDFAPAELLGSLRERFAILVGRKGKEDRRRRALRAAIDESWELLSPEERSFFARLSVFRGGFDEETAALVTGEDRDSNPQTYPIDAMTNAAGLGSRFYVLGGVDGQSKSAATLSSFDVNALPALSVVAHATMANDRANAAVVAAPNGKLYVFGGDRWTSISTPFGHSAQQAPLDSVEEFQP